MLIAVLAYVVCSVVMMFVCAYLKTRTQPISNCRLTKYGLVFCSNKRHKIKVGEAKILQLENVVYIKREGKMVVLKNVDRVFNKNEYLYFTALGEVKIIFNCKKFYRYFNVNISSQKFDLNPLKQLAINELLDNLFNLNACSQVKRYIYLLTEVLKISISATRVEVKQNKYHIPFCLTYKLNNKIKRIQVN